MRQVLDAVGGNKTHAARILGIDRRSLYRRLEEPRAGEAPRTDRTVDRRPGRPREAPATVGHPAAADTSHGSNGPTVARTGTCPGRPIRHSTVQSDMKLAGTNYWPAPARVEVSMTRDPIASVGGDP